MGSNAKVDKKCKNNPQLPMRFSQKLISGIMFIFYVGLPHVSQLSLVSKIDKLSYALSNNLLFCGY